ncbi:MAG: hypothetical protein V3T88_09060 [Nitrosomonadaceae bacterium]
MSELQNEDTEAQFEVKADFDTGEEQVNENPETGSELAPETEATEQTQVSEETEEQKAEKRQAAFNKQYGEKKQAERERDAANAEIARLQQAQYQPPPEAGKMPNEYDYDTTEEFHAAQQTYISNVKANATHEAQQEVINNGQLAQQQAVQQQKFQKFQTDLVTYQGNAKKLGIDAQELEQAENTAISYGLTHELQLAILEEPDGPLIAKHLAANPQDVATLVGMNPYAAGAFIANTLRAKAGELKPKTSNTPDPATNIQGGGVDPENGKYKHLKGVTFS